MFRLNAIRILTSHLSDIDKKINQLDPRLDNLEAKAVKSMQYHVDTNNALTTLQSQMTQMMGMLTEVTKQTQQRPNQSSTAIDEAMVTPSTKTNLLNHNGDGTPQPGQSTAGGATVTPMYADHMRDESRSVASNSSGSQHAKPPPKKNLKRSMPDAMENMTLESQPSEDESVHSSTSSSFGESPPMFPFTAADHPPSLQLTQYPETLSHDTSAMDTDENTLNYAMPDLEDQYKLTDETESRDPKSPDGGDNG